LKRYNYPIKMRMRMNNLMPSFEIANMKTCAFIGENIVDE